VDDSRDGTGHSDVKSGNRNRPTTPPTPSPFRGRFPSFYAPQASAFRGFNDAAFSIFQRRNRRILQHVTGRQNDERFEQMMKMVLFYYLIKKIKKNFCAKITKKIAQKLKQKTFTPKLKQKSFASK